MNPIPYNGDGGYLSKNDIIKGMAAEIEMLKKELNISNQMKFTYMDDCTKMLAEYARLKAEVERLRKAGDAMASSIQFNEEMAQDYNGPTIVHQSVKAWTAAKEGKPSV